MDMKKYSEKMERKKKIESTVKAIKKLAPASDQKEPNPAAFERLRELIDAEEERTHQFAQQVRISKISPTASL